jgi:hypothetical protein
MNTYTLYIHGRALGRVAFQRGLPCIPEGDGDLRGRGMTVSPSAIVTITDGWRDGWRGAEIDLGGR